MAGKRLEVDLFKPNTGSVAVMVQLFASSCESHWVLIVAALSTVLYSLNGSGCHHCVFFSLLWEQAAAAAA